MRLIRTASYGRGPVGWRGCGRRHGGRRTPISTRAVGIHSGLACWGRQRSSLRLRRHASGGRVGSSREGWFSCAIVFHGDRDTTVHPKNGNWIFEQSGKAASFDNEGASRTSACRPMPITRTILIDGGGQGISEHWNIHGAGHAWSGGNSAGFLHRSAGGRTLRGKCCASSSSIRLEGSRTSQCSIA